MLTASPPYYSLNNHYRSQSDNTNFKSYYYKMSEPRTASFPFAYRDIPKGKKRAFAEIEKDTDGATEAAIATSLTTSKKAKTAPSSPVSHLSSSQFVTPKTPMVTLPELPLTPPQTATCTSAANLRSSFNDETNSDDNEIRSDSPTTPPPSTQSSPIRHPKILKLDRKPFNIIPESALYYPDTCYSFQLLNSSTIVPQTNERACVLEHQNSEWRSFYNYKVSHDNGKLYKKYRNYCEELQTKESPSTPELSNLRTGNNNNNTQISHSSKTLLPTSSKLASFVENQYNRYDGLINYPYATNYRYQNSGYLHDVNVLTTSPELYHHESSKGFTATGDHPRNYNLPPLSQVLKMSSLAPKPLETLPHRPHTPPTRSNIKSKSPRASPVSKFINTSVGQDRTTTTTTIPAKPTSPRRHNHPHSHRIPRTCISCHSTQSPCWRPSWAPELGQLCNSCGLRYKKTRARCLNHNCLRIPAKGEWMLMKNRGKVPVKEFDADGNQIGEHLAYKCLHCDGEVSVDEN